MANAQFGPVTARALPQPDPRNRLLLKRYLSQATETPGVIEQAILRPDADLPLSQFPTLDATQQWIAKDVAHLGRKHNTPSPKWYKTSAFVSGIKDCLERKPDNFSPQLRHWALTEFYLGSDGSVYQKDGSYVVVREKFHKLMVLVHGMAGHGGRDATAKLFRELNLDGGISKRMVQSWIDECPNCERLKRKQRGPRPRNRVIKLEDTTTLDSIPEHESSPDPNLGPCHHGQRTAGDTPRFRKGGLSIPVFSRSRLRQRTAGTLIAPGPSAKRQESSLRLPGSRVIKLEEFSSEEDSSINEMSTEEEYNSTDDGTEDLERVFEREGVSSYTKTRPMVLDNVVEMEIRSLSRHHRAVKTQAGPILAPPQHRSRSASPSGQWSQGDKLPSYRIRESLQKRTSSPMPRVMGEKETAVNGGRGHGMSDVSDFRLVQQLASAEGRMQGPKDLEIFSRQNPYVTGFGRAAGMDNYLGQDHMAVEVARSRTRSVALPPLETGTRPGEEDMAAMNEWWMGTGEHLMLTTEGNNTAANGEFDIVKHEIHPIVNFEQPYGNGNTSIFTTAEDEASIHRGRVKMNSDKIPIGKDEELKTENEPYDSRHFMDALPAYQRDDSEEYAFAAKYELGEA